SRSRPRRSACANVNSRKAIASAANAARRTSPRRDNGCALLARLRRLRLAANRAVSREAQSAKPSASRASERVTSSRCYNDPELLKGAFNADSHAWIVNGGRGGGDRGARAGGGGGGVSAVRSVPHEDRRGLHAV